jgi:putative transposase
MKRTYQIEERKAIEAFRSHLLTNPGSIQMIVPLAEVAQRLRRGVSEMLLVSERALWMLIMLNEAAGLSGSGEGERWGTAPGSVIMHGQKIPIARPRVRYQQREMKLGSYELFRQDDIMQRQIWERVVRGLTMRGYGPAVRECAPAFGISKSAVSDRFITASGQRVEDLRKRNLSKLRLCALLMDGVEYRGEHFVVALGVDKKRASRWCWASTRAPAKTSKSAIACWRTWHPGVWSYIKGFWPSWMEAAGCEPR